MIAPMLVERLQHQIALELAHELGSDLRLLAGVLRERDLVQAIAQRRVGDIGIAFQPLAHRRLHLKVRSECDLEPRYIPLFLDRFGRHVALHRFVDQTDDHVADGVGDIRRLEQLVALLVDHAALVVGYVVIFEQLLADIEVARLDAILRLGDRAIDDRMFDRLALGHFETLHDRAEALAAEDAKQRIFERKIEARRPRVTLTSGATAELIVDTPRFVALGADDMEPTGRDDGVVPYLPLAAQATYLRFLGDRLQGFVLA